jgi:hypothetical protein
MTTWIRKTPDSSDEQIITIGMIVSDVFISKATELFDLDFIVNDSLRTICSWCLSYFKDFGSAPKNHIQDIFEERRFGIDRANAKLIEEFLQILNKRYVDFSEPVNDEYFLVRAKRYFTKRNLKIKAERIRALLDLNKIEEAEAELSDYKQFTFLASQAINPFSPDIIKDVVTKKEEALLQFPGALGNLIGPIGRGNLVGVLGIFKRGKTKFLLYTASYAASCKLKVVFCSLEMQKEKVAENLIRNIGTFTKENDRLFPVFDCRKNQLGTCDKHERQNDIPLIINGEKPPFDASLAYKPCTYCRFNDYKEYEVATWFEELNYPDITFKEAVKKGRAFQTMYGDNIRILTYPRFTANIRDIEKDLSLLEEKEMFIPDVIIVDYAGILKPEDPREDRRIQIDTTWKRLAQLASERQCAVFTATQGTRGAIYKKNTDQTDVAEWIGIIGHVDIMLTLNQTRFEKKEKIIRVGVLANRDGDFDEMKNALLLTNYGAGQFAIDSELVDIAFNDSED